ncbi:PLP-dependent transferase [Multifurca ochricompacta]|uniref:PLP-dependent transferase n=1 Tax=Multifurca ochricompacta TaxID=376703 RepID=A0AAD4M7M5_9AGAM|nr:PLP-dependent transferase [Multifurca ochricompacta]
MTSFQDTARVYFPALRSGFVFADNAGGSQCTKLVAERIFDYLLNTNVQPGADYPISVESTRCIAAGPVAAAELFNAASPDEIVFGATSTMNLENLARSLEKDILDDEEIVVTGEHEANVGPWKKLAARKGLTLKHWRPRTTDPSNPYSLTLDVEDLLPLISAKTRIVAFVACSNILGSIVPVKAIVTAARSRAVELGVRKIEFSVDCVAYAPHRRMNVQDWDVDYAVFSFYKLFGPHISALYARAASLRSSISALTHHFLSVDTVGYKLQPGGPGYELVYGAAGVPTYLKGLTPAGTLEATFIASAVHEHVLSERLLGFLRGYAPRVLIVGDPLNGSSRVPTISFVVKGILSRDVVRACDETGTIGIRYGHFYAYTFINELDPKIDIQDGVVRVSLVHYNTLEEVDRIIIALRGVLG